MQQVKKILSFRPGSKSKQGELGREIRRWRDECPADERLNEGSRAQILAEVRQMRRTGAAPEGRRFPLASLFVPTRRVALAGALPVLVLALALGFLVTPRGPNVSGAIGQDGAVRLEATKQGDDVVFLIANGGHEHRIYRTDNPRIPAGAAYATTQGVFRDRLDAGGAVVFYRID